ncbi:MULTISPECIES: 50S ribosomal protein L18 [Thermotoga]|jgi:large subunit ribosomal protein L18|uniref:Large ribosomal subunit protein uL18 n=1 Tax=Thermotoga neapolitana (strain ATCC 49049 / DSM 4359 / NBRC 107923 / NS-E) TaxID=309803 RepID=RL18_THENN|nr:MULTISPECIES: 50S ribosomal protein L18 [Thermotoga]B9K8A2.1 RecName: Full=Large ribosomal subunit protein uL18; AltName: Full=50S ribosomal protein L18 [Thermotoga neapolitana DSM 4359]MDK2785749.1 large subunit ribosomal protein [Thermotoga sp.]HBF11536.1 50S ribosomal protein L18 [Thermotoga neapolitana]ACM23185.1 50S ribosomal protein L18 [Thermotoga neapolitana DSM 4359]AJG41098.1 50S ribosomal protein L18 [Thermotoga sp. RQ7]KFZ21688.1 50S ribosomal protein L18 [Thermotoga neapolitan
MIKKESRNERRIRRHRRVRKKVFGTPERPRLCVFRSNKHIYAQIIDDTIGHTLVSASTLDPELREKLQKTWNIEAAKEVGLLIGKRAIEKGIKKVVFDRGGYKYHGRVKALADGAREAGLEF